MNGTFRRAPAALALMGACALSIACGRAGPTDAQTTAAVKSNMVSDPLLKDSVPKIDVETKRHVVTLMGTVPSDRAKSRALVAARRAKGVTEIVDLLQVQGRRAATLPAAGHEAPPEKARTTDGGR